MIHVSFRAHLYSLCTRFHLLISASSTHHRSSWKHDSDARHTCVMVKFLLQNSPPPVFLQHCPSPLSTPLCFKTITQASSISITPTHMHTKYFPLNCNMLVVPTAVRICWLHTTHTKQQHHPLVPCHHFHSLNYGKPQEISCIQIAVSALMPLIKFITTS